jgi:hypothetical protein
VNVQVNVPVALTTWLTLPSGNAHAEKSDVGLETTDVIVALGSNPCPEMVIGPFPTKPELGLIVSAGFTVNGVSDVTVRLPPKVSLAASDCEPSAASPTANVHENDPSVPTVQVPTTGAVLP